MLQSDYSILLVEDNTGHAALVQRLLRSLGSARFEFHVVDLIAAAIARLDAGPAVDVVLLDLSLPDSTGEQTVKKLCGRHPLVPVIVLTAAQDEGLAVQSLMHGAQDFLVKGQFDPQTAFRAIRYAIERQRTVVLEQDRVNLRAATKGMEEVLGVVGHELRTPLASIRLIAEHLQNILAKESEPAALLGTLHDESLRMSDMVNNMLEAARLNSGVAQWQWGTSSVAGFCNEAIEGVRSFAASSGVSLGCDVSPGDLSLRGDEGALRRLTLNLLVNAHKHTKQGSIHVTATGGDWEGHPSVTIDVRDTGSGITPEQLKRLGTAFALNAGTVGVNYTKGAGLGLSICRSIAAAHGGTITVASTGPEGTTIRVRLRADMEAPPSRITPPKETPGEAA